MTERVWTVSSEEEMTAFGERLGKLLTGGCFTALHGGLGAGKTALVRGVGRALGQEDITSPTFTIVQEYDTVPRLCHFDAYRLADEDELYAMGFDDYCDDDSLILMEWAELVEGAVPEERLDITIEGSGADLRTVRIIASGAAYEAILEKL
ncbi:MAG: tRNA (adenosine(37)-N6)-threonylcarbamoyltransferase complex ATPase subunit type 1 TsaE [Clostridia bacterium]|nr:tRNA (adenosine(37)-N6)-threonylcarbamoyltransferase complex ATPase subunit type 1 TsaE [Clostridia bacterium]